MERRNEAVRALGPVQTIDQALHDKVNPPPGFSGTPTKRKQNPPSDWIVKRVVPPVAATIFDHVLTNIPSKDAVMLASAQGDSWHDLEEAPYRIFKGLEIMYSKHQALSKRSTEAAVSRDFDNAFGRCLEDFLYLLQSEFPRDTEWEFVIVPEYARCYKQYQSDAPAAKPPTRKRKTPHGAAKKGQKASALHHVRLDLAFILRRVANGTFVDYCFMLVEFKNDGCLS